MNFLTLFDNHFASHKMNYISDEELKDFSQDGMARITANNGGGLFTTILSDTLTAHTNYFGSITDKDVKFAVQQSLTMSKDNIVKTFKQTVSEKSGLIQSTFAGGKNSPEWQQFFPLGLTEYTNATMGNIEVLMNRMVSASSANSGALGAAFVAIWTNIQTNYTTARSLQQNKMGEVGVAREAVDTNRLPLELQWCKNLHFIGYTYPGNSEIAATFFNQSLLKNKKASTLDPNLYSIKGKITLQGSTTPIPGVQIKVVETGNTYTSENNGSYLVAHLNPGTYTLELTKALHEVETITGVVVSAGAITTVDASLTPLITINGTLSGTVFSAALPVGGVTVSVDGHPLLSTLTTAAGNYTLINIPIGTQTIRAQMPPALGGSVQTQLVNIVAGPATNLNFNF